MEIATLFVINKADKPEAEILRRQLENNLASLPADGRPPIVLTSADRAEGIAQMVEALQTLALSAADPHLEKKRSRIEEEIRTSVLFHLNGSLSRIIQEMTEKVLAGHMSPMEAAMEILDQRMRSD